MLEHPLLCPEVRQFTCVSGYAARLKDLKVECIPYESPKAFDLRGERWVQRALGILLILLLPSRREDLARWLCRSLRCGLRYRLCALRLLGDRHHAFRQRPFRECRKRRRLAVLIELHPHLCEVVEVATQPIATTCPFKGLCFRSGHRVLVISPHFAAAGV